MTQSNHTTTITYQQLSAEERGQIEAFLKDHQSVRQIARNLHRNPSTISREIKRGTVRQLNSDYLPYYQYFAEAGQAVYEKDRLKCHSKGLLKRCWLFFKLLVQALKTKIRVDSVDSFVHRFHQLYPDKPCPSTPTVYRYIDLGYLDLCNADLPVKLRRRVKSTRRTRSRKNKKILGSSIDERPAIVDQRILVGDWEGDLVKGKRVASEPALMTLTERVSRFEIIVKIPDYHADTCRQALQGVITAYGPKNFQSITFDNGSEFAELDQVQGTKVYFAHPYTPSERGSNENLNGLIREYIPKGISLKNFDLPTIQAIQNALNHRLRKSLGYASAAQVFKTQVFKNMHPVMLTPYCPVLHLIWQLGNNIIRPFYS